MSLYWSLQALTLGKVKDKYQTASPEEFAEWLDAEIERVSKIADEELGDYSDSSDCDYDPRADYDE